MTKVGKIWIGEGDMRKFFYFCCNKLANYHFNGMCCAFVTRGYGGVTPISIGGANRIFHFLLKIVVCDQ